jgi:hypothetical protein
MPVIPLYACHTFMLGNLFALTMWQGLTLHTLQCQLVHVEAVPCIGHRF